MIAGYRPFKGEEEIKKGIIGYDPNGFPNPDGLLELGAVIQGCLDPDLVSRFTIKELSTGRLPTPSICLYGIAIEGYNPDLRFRPANRSGYLVTNVIRSV